MTTIGAPNQTIAAEPIVKNNVQQATTPADIQVPPPAPKEDGGNKLMNALTGLAMIGAGTMLLYNLRKGKGINAQTLEKFKAQGGKFEKGVAKLADGSNFTGVINKVDEAGNTYIRIYNNGQLTKAAKNVDYKGFADPTKAENFIKEYTYTAEGKIQEIKQTVMKDGECIENILGKKNIQTYNKFANEGGYVFEGEAINADGSKFNGHLVGDVNGDTVIHEFANGKLVSERLNTTLKGNVMKPGANNYVLDEAGIIAREEARAAEIATRKAEEAARIAKENKWFRRLGRSIKNIFTRNPKTETPTS